MISALSWARTGSAKIIPSKSHPFGHPDDNNPNDDDNQDEELDDNQDEEQDSEDERINQRKQKDRERQADEEDDNLDDQMMGDEDPEAERENLEREGLGEYNLHLYDEEESVPVFDDDDPEHISLFDQDPNITVPTEEIELEELEEFLIKPTDRLLVTGTSEDSLSHLDLYIYEVDTRNLYLHHDILLQAPPLCVTTSDYHPHNPNKKGSLAAVGTFEPAIEIWDLDILDPLEPLISLGGVEAGVSMNSLVKKSSKAQKKKIRRHLSQNQYKPDSHRDAVLALAWNQFQREMIASGSADNSIKLWDISTAQCTRTLSVHTDKVQALDWHPVEMNILLSGAYDKTVTVLDGRSFQLIRFSVNSDLEAVKWNPHSPTQFYTSSEDGMVQCFDSRQTANALYRIHAHNKAVHGLSISPLIGSLIATCSADKEAKIWDLTNSTPSCIASIRPELEVLLSISFSLDEPFAVAIGGTGKPFIWDLSTKELIQQRYASSQQQTA